MAKSKALICPYCGETQPLSERCRACGGLFEPLSRQATHNEMGPWYIRDAFRPFQPGCSYETLIKLIERGQVTKVSIIRGPTTKQFWTLARRVPGVSHLLGYCHNCDASVDVGDHGCHACGVPFGAYLDRNYLGLPEVRPLPWEAPADDDGARVEPASARMMDFRRAAEPLGISSFASDEELRSGGGPGGFSIAAQTSTTTGFIARMGEAHDDATSPAGTEPSPLDAGGSARVTDDLQAAIAARAVQRKIDDQRRMIRWLAIGMVFLAALAVVAIAIAVQRSMQPSNDGTLPNTSPAKAPDIVPPPAAEHAEPATSEITAGQPVANAPPSIDVAAELASAQEQIAIGGQQDRPAEERIAAYQEALRILKAIESNATANQKPADLAERIKSVQKSLDELQLKSLFP